MAITNIVDFVKTYDIEIPIIQRDYVYGREQSQKTGKALLEAIKQSLETDKNLDLNFIYGIECKRENEKEKSYYYPIDGQQRATTLYLFYWYVAIKSGNEDDFYSNKPYFTYKTRSSASDFFLWISDKKNDKLFDLVSDRKLTEDEVRNMPGFKAAWNYDTTVKSCLYMLRQIAEMVTDKETANNYYEKLIDDSKCPIKFTVIREGEDINEDDKNSLQASKAKANQSYIRMNARGKELTDFEKIKSYVDSLETQEENTNKFSYHYDMTYIDSIYDSVKRDKSIDGLYAITKEINEKSWNYFKNVWEIVLAANGKDMNCDYVASLKLHTGKIIQEYIKCMDCYMSYIAQYYNEQNDLWKESNIFKPVLRDADKKKLAAEIYFVYFSTERNTYEVEEYILFLENLRYKDWNCQQLKELAEEIGNNKLIEYLRESGNTKRPECLPDLDDIGVRWKEQVKLAYCCKLLSKDYKYFQDYRAFDDYRIETGKLQAIQYISGIWDKDDFGQEDAEKFEKNLERYKKYGKDNVLWLQDYATVAYDGVDSDEVNQKPNLHKWADAWYFWNDDEEQEESYRNHLSIAKRVYEKSDEDIGKQKESLISFTPSKSENRTWLSYALLLSGKIKDADYESEAEDFFRWDLVNSESTGGSLGTVIVANSREEEPEPFMMRVLQYLPLTKEDGEKYHFGLKDWKKTIIERKYTVNGSDLPYSDFMNGTSRGYENSRWTVKVVANAELHEPPELIKTIENEKVNFLYSYASNEYIIYEYQKDNPTEFLTYKFNAQNYEEAIQDLEEKWSALDLKVVDQVELAAEWEPYKSWVDEAKYKKGIADGNTDLLWRDNKDNFYRLGKTCIYDEKLDKDYTFKYVGKGKINVDDEICNTEK